MSSEITRYEDGENISLSRPPKIVLAEAKEAAQALVDVIALKSKPVKFNGETYLEFEDWQTVGKFYGCTTKVTRTAFVEYGDVKGFEATAVVVDRLGNEIGSAESMCLNDEENWGAVPKYEWKDTLDANGKKQWVPPANGKKGYYKGEKIQIGTAPKPLFQLKSMAQTRAGAKALRSVFSWVVVLAGFKPTVAEELNESQFLDDQTPEKKAAPMVQRKSEKSGGLPPMGPAQAKAAASPAEPVICSECRIEDGHAPSCPYNPDNKNKAAEAAAATASEHGDAYEGDDTVTDAKPEQTKEEKRAAREKAWVEYPGHDPKKHIRFSQAGLLFIVQGKMGISEDQMKDYMAKNLKVEHRPHILKEHFTPLLDALDPAGTHHKLGGK